MNGLPLSLSGLRTLVLSTTIECQKILEDRLLLKLTTGTKDLLQQPLVDELNNTTPGYSFITDTRNKLCPTQDALYRHVVASMDTHFHQGVLDGHISWRTTAMHDYLQHCHDFLTLLGPLIHLTYGSPARCEELMATIINLASSARNVFTIHQRNSIVLTLPQG